MTLFEKSVIAKLDRLKEENIILKSRLDTILSGLRFVTVILVIFFINWVIS